MKRCIAILMLAVYLFAVGAPVYVAMTCHCVSSTVTSDYRCCSHCNHDNSLAKGRVYFESSCCGDHHSTEIELYTASLQDLERQAKRLVTLLLPPTILAEPLVLLDHTSLVCGYVADEGVSSVPDSHVSSCGLRAPPVLV